MIAWRILFVLVAATAASAIRSDVSDKQENGVTVSAEYVPAIFFSTEQRLLRLYFPAQPYPNFSNPKPRRNRPVKTYASPDSLAPEGALASSCPRLVGTLNAPSYGPASEHRCDG